MSLEIIQVQQGTAEWLQARLGIPTASEFESILAKGRGGKPSKTRLMYMRKLAGELLTGKLADSFSNSHMERGHELEPEARALYRAISGNEPVQVGFLKRDGRVGCSPDSMVLDDGLLEIKTKLPHLQLEVLEDGVLPEEHVAQVQGQMWVSGRQWVDFFSYWPGLPPFLLRVQRDENYIATLKVAVDEFIAELHALVEKYR